MNTYTLTPPKLDGHIELQYNGNLTAVIFVLKSPLNEKQFRAIVTQMPQAESGLTQLEPLGLKVEAATPANAKLALFCRKYEEYKGIKYKVSPPDSGKIKLISFDEPMLVFYFTSDNFLFKGKHSVSNLVKYYNELRAEIAAGPKSIHPDYWSPKHNGKLDAEGQSDYIKHLHSKGLRPVKDSMGNVKDWVKNS